MSSKYKQTGIKVSQYPLAHTNENFFKNRLELNHHFLTWAADNYGVSSIHKNYQISIGQLRDDNLGYIGVENSKGKYRNYLTFWQGNWSDSQDITNSYIYQWNPNHYNDKDYIANKHGLNAQIDIKNNVSRVFLLKTAPLPLESTDSTINSDENKTFGTDPNPNNFKIVDKNYVDDRHNGIRKIEKTGSILQIRPYTCFYQYSNLPDVDAQGTYCIDIRDSQIMQDGKTIEDKIRHNRVMFFLRIKNNDALYYKLNEQTNEKYHCNNFKILVNGKDQVKWSYEDELTEILRQNRPKYNAAGQQENKSKQYIFIRCEAEYINNEFTVTCSNFFGRSKNIKRIVQVEVPQSGVVPTIDLSLHENESFITQIPEGVGEKYNQMQTVISFDASKLNDFHQYSWNYYIVTPSQVIGEKPQQYRGFDNVIFDSSETPIMWAMQDGYNVPPMLQPNKIYCFEFIKVFDDVIIGRIKYFINLIKKS